MMLAALILIPAIAGLLAWYAERWGEARPRWISLIGMVVALGLGLWIWMLPADGAPDAGAWLAQTQWRWIPRFGIHVHLALDGVSLMLILLTCFLGIVSVAASWREIRERVGFFHFNLLWTLAGSIGVFLALDLFLFFFFWELMLVPMYFLIALWGHENRVYASFKFFIFTQGSGLLMLVSILALVFLHYHATGVVSFDYFDLLDTPMAQSTAYWVMLGFFVAFAVKLPAVPFHPWLPDAHTEAPTAGSIVLAGILLKTGAYGLLRFVVPLFPQAAFEFRPIAMSLAVIGILYGAFLAFSQHDLKRLIAYSSVSHLGFVLLGIFAANELAYQGAVMQMLAHGISTGALFFLVGALAERTHTRDLVRMGGLWETVPRLAAVGLFFAIASLGLPGLGNFVGEFLVLLGAYRVSIPLTAVAAVGLVTAAIYSLVLVQKAFHGPNRERWVLADLAPREMSALAAMVAIIVWLGLYPQPVLDTTAPAYRNVAAAAAGKTP